MRFCFGCWHTANMHIHIYVVATSGGFCSCCRRSGRHSCSNCKVCVSVLKGKYTVDDSPLGLSITTCAVDEMTHHCGKS